jgi:uncharacterized protein YggT (Ycf19 family)
MSFSGWDTLINILAAAFWFGAWGMDSRYAFFNSYLRPLHGRAEAVLAFLRPVFANAPDRAIALACAVALLVLKAFLAPRAATWELSLGTHSAAVAAHLPPGQWTEAVAWSFLSFGIFMFAFWSLACPYLGFSRRPEGQVQTALHALSAPFSWLPPAARPVVLLLFGTGLAFLLPRLGAPPESAGLPWFQAVFAAVSEWVALLDVLSTAVLIAIVGHWIGMGTGSERLQWMCSEWLEHLLGPLRNRQVRVGMLDVTPLIFFFGLRVVQYALLRMIDALPVFSR